MATAADALPPARSVRTRDARVRCMVSGGGRPVIVLVNGAGMPLESWRGLYPGIERLGRVMAWNRPGLPGSPAVAGRLAAADVVAALRALLSRLELPPPYVLVAHSLGCLHAQLFARLHPADVSGLLLLAPTPAADAAHLVQRRADIVRSLARVTGCPAAALRRNVRAELAGFDATVQALAEAGPMPGVPLRVIAHRGHFPQIRDPGRVLAELRALVAAVNRPTRGPAPTTPAAPRA